VISLLSNIGPLKSFRLIKDPTTLAPKGYGFFEFVDPKNIGF
jgi:RNA recognition motif-containing protein